MAVPTMAYLYASPPSSFCSTPYPTSYDFEVSSRSSSTSSQASTSQKPVVGGLTCLFSSSSSPASVRHHAAGGGEDRGGDEMKELSSSFRYSPSNKFIGSSSSSLINRDQSPVSVFHGPVSCSGSSTSSSTAARSHPIWNGRERTGNDLSIRGGSNGIFNGFVRNALVGSSSSVDYDSPSFEVCKDSSSVDELLPFDMEDGLIESNPKPYAKDLLQNAQLRHKIFYEDVVIKAFYEAEKAHRGQMRASGDPYLQHCVETAVLLALIGANPTVVAAGLLHDTLDDSFMGYDYILSTFGPGVADLVKAVSKLSHLSKLARENNMASKMIEADRFHTMFLAMVDARAVLIKLADRLHNMTTLDALPLEKGKRFAKETLEIFAPLANRLGIFTWKEQLENLCFKHLYPEEHKDLSSKLVESFDEEMITSAIEKLERALKKKGVSYHLLSGRHKSLYSIYRKMSKKKLSTDEIHDIHGLRLIVEDEKDCYTALEVVHKLWSEVPGKLKDYINHPKFNGYQSLHTVVMGEKMFPLEVQIRTKEMHLQAEFGFAAHWRYKEGDVKHSSFVLQMVEWARWVVTWQCETMRKDQPSSVGFIDSIKPSCKFPFHSEDCPYNYKPCSGQDEPVFVIVIENDKMSVQEFSANSTIVDLLQRAGRGSSRLAHYGFPMKEDLRPRLNHEPVSDTKCMLKMGDVVELTPAIPDKSLTEYREEIQRMYNRGLTVPSPAPHAPTTMSSWR